MARYIELDALVAEINKRIIDAPINNIGHQRVWVYNDVKDIINTLKVKEVDLDCNITGIKTKHAEGKLKECIESITEESLSNARKQLQKDPVSEELDVIAREYAGIPCDAPKDLTYCVHDKKAKYDAVLFGANWKEQQFEKNRLAACDRQTEEEAEIERDFCMGIIEKEHRQPTFDDAIKYGYHKAEKDLELTWEDMEVIQEIANNYTKYHTMEPRIFVYKEILKRFNERREK